MSPFQGFDSYENRTQGDGNARVVDQPSVGARPGLICFGPFGAGRRSRHKSRLGWMFLLLACEDSVDPLGSEFGPVDCEVGGLLAGGHGRISRPVG